MPANIIGRIISYSLKIAALPKVFTLKIGGLFFKKILVPGYKFFLFLNKRLIISPQISVNSPFFKNKPKSLVHLIILLIALIVAGNNLATRDIYAEEFSDDSIFAQLFNDDFDDLIIENYPSAEQRVVYKGGKNIFNELGVLTPDGLSGAAGEQGGVGAGQSLIVSQGGEVLIRGEVSGDNEAGADELAGAAEIGRKEIVYYTVESGDTLSGIAAKFKVTVNTILWENKISLGDYIRPGDKLAILPIEGVSYTVRSGDTLSAIAKKFGTSVDKIISFNDLKAEDLLKVTQKIIIPGGRLGVENLAPARGVASLNKVFSRQTEKTGEGGFFWPSNSKRITQYYHWQHHAIDIGAKKGTPIYAVAGGIIERSGWSQGYGYNIIINHGNGIKTLYAHASDLYVDKNEEVSRGQVIGAVGSTGWSTGPHIHLELIIGGKKVNPLSYF